MNKSIKIIGAGPVGSLLAIYMAKRGYEVVVYEKRSDPRKTLIDDGRSINLALSHRGIHALKKAGLEEVILREAIPMHGRMVHDIVGKQTFYPYGEQGQFINSVSRGGLNRTLIEMAERDFSIQFCFDHKCIDVDFDKQILNLTIGGTSSIRADYKLLAATDGAFSTVRTKINSVYQSTTELTRLTHGYKELTISPKEGQIHSMEKSALHIWPRGNFMLIALPNADGSFTCTLFLPFEGENSFNEINTKDKFIAFFKENFSDALPLIDQAEEAYFAVEPADLFTAHTFPWVHQNVFLIGDAAHAMVPFYGQGMNAGFEDVRILDELLTSHHENWTEVLPLFQNQRKPNTDAITELAMQNFVEMRDLVDDEKFILRKKIEAAIHLKHKSYSPLYSMVTFSDTPYLEAFQRGKDQDALMDQILSIPNIKETWENKEGWQEIEKLLNKQIPL